MQQKRTHASPPLGKRNWTKAEEEYLCESWGTVSIDHICKRLNRTRNAINVRVNRLGLAPYLESGEYISLNQLWKALGYTGGGNYLLKSWAKDRGMPIHNKRRGKSVVRVVYLDEFWQWAEKNRSFIDFSKMEPLVLGKEPDWLPEQRKKDYHAFAIQRKDPWTADEDAKLISLLRQHKYGYAEISTRLNRSAGAIQRRCNDLGIKERPVRELSGVKENEWTAEQYNILADGIRYGDSYTAIGNAIGKSEKAVRGKVYYTYLTERADKVREMLSDGEWGYGAPTPTVKQGLYLSSTRQQVKKDLTSLVTILRRRMNELGYDPYWQRFMCMHWDDVGGCAAGCTDCDSCTEFRRIPPQYCARCGGTFFERRENRFCESCRTARKKAAQRKYAILSNR